MTGTKYVYCRDNKFAKDSPALCIDILHVRRAWVPTQWCLTARLFPQASTACPALYRYARRVSSNRRSQYIFLSYQTPGIPAYPRQSAIQEIIQQDGRVSFGQPEGLSKRCSVNCAAAPTIEGAGVFTDRSSIGAFGNPLVTSYFYRCV